MTDIRDDAQQPASPRARLPHVVMDRGSRMHKARKIVALVGEDRFHPARRVLEIGCGSGVIASTLAVIGGDSLAVDAVDVVDNPCGKRRARSARGRVSHVQNRR